MKNGNKVTLNQINKLKSKMFIEAYKEGIGTFRFDKPDARAWWRRTKQRILDTTVFTLISLPKRS